MDADIAVVTVNERTITKLVGLLARSAFAGTKSIVSTTCTAAQPGSGLARHVMDGWLDLANHGPTANQSHVVSISIDSYRF
jgi:hypothetical protein